MSPGTVARRIAIQRATTVGSMSGLCQVIIRNTNSKDLANPVVSASINRSQSLLTTNRVPILAPSRADRIRLESILADVWTREFLPYPGMGSRGRNEILTRASASSIMRKLSVVSIASNFTKRSGSMASLRKAADEESHEMDLDPRLVDREMQLVDSITFSDLDEALTTRLSMLQDEKENRPHTKSDRPDISRKPIAFRSASYGSSMSNIHRLATVKVKAKWGIEGHHMLTPPLRTSSANNIVAQSRSTTNLTIFPDRYSEEKENQAVHSSPPLTSPSSISLPSIGHYKSAKRSRLPSRPRTGMAEGIRSLFR